MPRSWLILAMAAAVKKLGSMPWQEYVPTTVEGNGDSDQSGS